MAQLEQCLRQIVEQSGDCVASGYLDIDDGKLMAFHGAGAHQRATTPLIALAAAELLQQSNAAVQSLQALLCSGHGGLTDDLGPPRELMMRAQAQLNIFLRSRTEPARAVVVVFDQQVNPGMALSESRSALRRVETLTA